MDNDTGAENNPEKNTSDLLFEDNTIIVHDIPEVDQDENDGKKAVSKNKVLEPGNQSQEQAEVVEDEIEVEEAGVKSDPELENPTQDNQPLDRKKWNQGMKLGKLAHKLYSQLASYLDEYGSDLSDDEDEERVLEMRGQLAGASSLLGAQGAQAKPAQNDSDEKGPVLSAEPPSLGPKYRTDLYKYSREKSGDWIPKLVTSLQEERPNLVEEHEEYEEPLSSTFEVITMYSLSQNSIIGRDVKVNAKLGTYIIIYSPEILASIREVVDYYPMAPFKQPSLILKEPFCLLLHYKAELTQLVKKRDEQQNSSSAEEAEHDKSQRSPSLLSPLLHYLSETYDSALAQEQARWNKEHPTCTFQWLWLLFRPGTVAVSWKESIPYAYTVSIHNREETGNQSRTVKAPSLQGHGPFKFMQLPQSLAMKLWSIDYDGKFLGRLQKTIIISPFEGEKPINALPVVPLAQWKDSHGISREALEDRLVKRGKEFFKLTKRTYCEYHGKAVSWPNRVINGRIMIDSELCYSDESFGGVNRIQRPRLGFEEDQERVESYTLEASREDHLRTRGKNTAEGIGFLRTHPDDEIDPFKTTELTHKQYLICSGSIWGFVTKLRTWELLDVENICPLVSKTDLIDDLVLDGDAKGMIKALSRSYTTQSDAQSREPGRWSADFIQNKGDGQIFLLHGKPGVGKTTTAECVSELTQRPLLSLTCGDLGTDPIQVEKTLMQWLRLGTVWEAILLLDEADVYLESRRAQDLQRNSLVSIFLRALEYYQGILFLTSNRVGTFDDAFISRIHVIIHYPPFQPAQRIKIWNTFFRRLEKERPNLRITPSVYDFISSDEALQNLEWNGREIRNAFNTAVALAEYENDVVDFHGQAVVNFHRRHLESVVKMSKAFQLYLTQVHGADQGRRAKMERIRDDFATPT